MIFQPLSKKNPENAVEKEFSTIYTSTFSRIVEMIYITMSSIEFLK